jgi:serine protease inhibitor
MQSDTQAHRSSTFATVILLLVAAFALPAAAGEAQNKALTSAYNALGQDLTRAFAAAPGNIVLSPYSIGTAMAMALSGARADTATEMTGVLKHTELSRIPRRLVGLSQAASAAGSSRAA